LLIPGLFRLLQAPLGVNERLGEWLSIAFSPLLALNIPTQSINGLSEFGTFILLRIPWDIRY